MSLVRLKQVSILIVSLNLAVGCLEPEGEIVDEAANNDLSAEEGSTQQVGGNRDAQGAIAKSACLTQSAVTYEKDIAPLVEENCIACHGPNSDDGDLTTYANVLGYVDDIRIRIFGGTEEQPLMPPSGKMETSKTLLFSDWVRGGTLERAAEDSATSDQCT